MILSSVSYTEFSPNQHLQKPKQEGLPVGEGRESRRGIIYSIKVTLCLALLGSPVPRHALGPPHPAKEPLGLPWHETCRQRRLTDRKENI